MIAFTPSGGKPVPFQSDEIHAANLGRIAVGDHEGRDVLHDFRTTARDRESANPAELMHRSESAHDRVVAHLHMAGERPVIRENHPIADGAIVTDVTVGEKIPPAAHPRLAFRRRAPVHGAKFAERILIPDLEIRRLARVFQILGLLPD